ncbi:organic solute transporter subunit alpha-like [Microplitis mediator]|uniref:organic solute transporter subunit alpha-like n=1 Tax=Microplitis mediator TaxID=375433 RepID=UPI0025575930|nr:organic solute transporter subunit alpha-like [Microplitis mediator]
MEEYLSVPEDTPIYDFLNLSCDRNSVPPTSEYLDRLGTFGTLFISIGSILTIATVSLTSHASYQIFLQAESKIYKRNCFMILWLYPIASFCSLVALSMPRTQLLSEAITQMALTISMYRVYLLITEVGRRKVRETPMVLKVGPCCCWPCLPFPILQFNDANLSWLRIIVLQFPIVQGMIYIIFLIMYMEDPIIYNTYNIFFQPLCVASILLALYGLNIAVMSLKQVNPEAKLQLKALVTQLVLFFSKLQASIIKFLPATGLFPCNPPITPQMYANFTYNALMLIEMLLLGYVATYMYGEHTTVTKSTTVNEPTLQTITTINLQAQMNKPPMAPINTTHNQHVQLPRNVA